MRRGLRAVLGRRYARVRQRSALPKSSRLVARLAHPLLVHSLPLARHLPLERRTRLVSPAARPKRSSALEVYVRPITYPLGNHWFGRAGGEPPATRARRLDTALGPVQRGCGRVGECWGRVRKPWLARKSPHKRRTLRQDARYDASRLRLRNVHRFYGSGLREPPFDLDATPHVRDVDAVLGRGPAARGRRVAKNTRA